MWPNILSPGVFLIFLNTEAKLFLINLVSSLLQAHRRYTLGLLRSSTGKGAN